MEFCASDRAAYEKLLADAPFELPKGWARIRIGDVFHLHAGKYISAKDIHNKCGEYPIPCFGGNGLRGYTAKANTHDIHAIIGRQGALCGCLNISDSDFYATEHAVVVDCYCGMAGEFAFHFLRALNLNRYATATAQPGLSVAVVNEVPFPLPPFNEQKRIVTCIEELFKVADSLGEAADGLDAAARCLDKKILDLAIRGKLVAQDPNDEPASELLKRIATTSHKSPCKNQEMPIEPPFEIPKSWKWVRLRELGIFCGGHTPSMSNPNFWGGNVLWVSSKDMKSKYITDTHMKVSQLGAEELKILKPGTLLMCTRSGILRRTFPIAIAKRELTINQDQRALTLWLPEMAEYIYVALKSLEPTILLNYKKAGTTVESIIWNKFIDLPIPLPPLVEQRRIVARVEELMRLLQALAIF